MTAKAEPNDLDAVMLIPSHFELQLEYGNEAALKLEAMLLTRQPEELFAAEDDDDCGRANPTSKGLGRGGAMIANAQEYGKAQEELRHLEERLNVLQREHPQAKGLTKAGVRKLMARLHEELAIYEGTQEVRPT